VDLRCTITNIGGVSDTRTIHWCMDAPFAGEAHVCYYDGDYFTLTLAPGDSYYYSSRNRGIDVPSKGHGDPVHIWLEDNKGGKSAECYCPSWGV